MSVAFIVATLLLSQISSHDIHLFFYIFFSLFKLFFHLFSKKKKKLFFSLLAHTPTVTFLPTFPFPFCLFIFPLLYRYTSLLFFIICLFFYFYTYFYISSNLSLFFFASLSPYYFTVILLSSFL